MAIEEINAAGGINKRKIVPVVADGKSDENIFAQEAERLILQEKVSVIVGCWSSASRKAVKEVVEKYNNLLLYPVAYEGIEDSKNILYVGANQNQQVIPSVLWSYYNLGKKFFLVGSDYIYSRVTNAIINATVQSMNGEVLGQEYILLGDTNVEPMIDKIIAVKPDVIINTIQGESNFAFFNQLRKKGITPEVIPVMSISSVSENEFAQIGANAMAGDYVTASYFQSVEREENFQFIANFRNKFGAQRVLNEAVESGYVSVHIWAQAAQIAQSSDAASVKKHLYNRVFNAPSGIVYVDNASLDVWKMVFVGKLRSDGQFTIVWDSKKQVQPLNYPIFKNKSAWDALVISLYEQWGKKWSRMAG
jgi:urea transport system substrate-binding protein